MNIYNNNDLYQILLDRLRKDRKGSINAEEFEAFLKNRSLDYFNQQFKVEGATKLNLDSLNPFFVYHDQLAVTTENAVTVAELTVLPTGTITTTDAYDYLTYQLAHIINVWALSTVADWSDVVEVDIVTHTEYLDRLNNSITKPTALDPIGYREGDKLWLPSMSGTWVLVDYYRYPAAPYYDYYTDSSGNITYLTEGQASYTLQTGEVSRSGAVAGAGVVSASVDLEWNDQDAMNILDMVMSDASLALTSQADYQGSVLERQQNVKS